jgi:hypothetical protein
VVKRYRSSRMRRHCRCGGVRVGNSDAKRMVLTRSHVILTMQIKRGQMLRNVHWGCWLDALLFFFFFDRVDPSPTLTCSFEGQYSWNHLTSSSFASATSMLVLLAVLTMYSTLSLAAADTCSPSELNICCTPAGARAVGKGTLCRNIVVDRSGSFFALTRRFGIMAHLAKASRFRSAVSTVPALPTT